MFFLKMEGYIVGVFEGFWELYEDSFPEDERRDKACQQRLLDNPRYKLIPYYKEKRVAAFMAFWDLDDFLFIEHFAVRQDLRGHGYGSKIIANLEEKYEKKIVLEVEPPYNILSQRRIKFYKKLGFYLNDYSYVQPAYDRTLNEVRLYLMSYPIPISPDKVDSVIEKIYKYVYNRTGD